MGNTSARPHPRQRNKKQVHWKAADRPARPGKPQLISDAEYTPDVITIRWDRPVKDGGSTIIGYLVEHRRTGSPHWVRATPLLVPFPELALSGLEPGWRYQFRVSAENAVGLSDPSELSEPLTVTLQRSAVTSPRFTQELKDTTALESDKVEFVTYFLGQPAPKVSWFKDGFEIFSSRRIRILTESDRSVLTIHQSQLVDAGEIRCSATNKAGHATTKALLTLEAPPTIRLPRQYEDGLLFEIGEVIRLKISVAGLPVPLVFWSHEGESIQNSERYEIETFDNSTTLRISEAKRSDRGEYQVKALNKLGQDQASFLVTVTDKPSPPGKARVVMTLGRSATLAWDTPEDDGGCKIGNYIIEYYRLGWDVWLKAATSRQLTTVLGDLIEGSQYKFRVKAESPYGISEPSEESDVVFIPDTKRGGPSPVLPRSASQPREVERNVERAPELPQRKNKPRSQSSSRVEEHRIQFNIPNGIPVRPERGKLKSPQRTPEQSPGFVRRELNSETINKIICDRSSIARDLSYGTPEFKITKTESDKSNDNDKQPPLEELLGTTKPKSTIQTIDRRPRSLSPMAKASNAIPNTKHESVSSIQQTLNVTRRSKSPTPERSLDELRRSKSPSPQLRVQNVDDGNSSPVPNVRLQNTRSPSPSFARKSKDFTGSSEFMLVLLPNGNKEDREASDIHFSFDENQIPPPLSLSAPELGTEPPAMESLKCSFSSTELLHERAMIRFYETAKAEELQTKKKLEEKDSQGRRLNIIPKIKINNQDENVALERQASMRRRYSSGITTQQQVLWAQRRHSLRNSEEINDLLEGKLKRYSFTPDEKREIMMNRTRSESEEKEEEEFERIRARMSQNTPKISNKTNVDVVDLTKWDDEYEESVSEEESSEDEKIYDQVPGVELSREDEDSTYHPTMRTLIERKTNEPFVILTKPNKLPDPNFVPKPILKRSAGVDLPKPPGLLNINELRSSSPVAETNIINRRPSSPLLKMLDRSSTSPELKTSKQQKRGSLPWSAPLALAINEDNDDKGNESNKKPLSSVSAIASISSVAAAGVIIPKSLLAKKAAEEEAKVVAEYYADIVKSHSQRKAERPRIETHNYEVDTIELSPSPPATPELPSEPTYLQIQSITPLQLIQKSEIFQHSTLNTNLSSAAPTFDTRRWTPQKADNTDSHWNHRIHNEDRRTRTDSSSSSQRSSSPSKSGRMRRGSPTILNKDVAAFRVGREPRQQEGRKVSSRPPSRTRTPSKSPGRRRKMSESPRRAVATSIFSTQTETTFRKSPSPLSVKRAPKMKEITTQTSTCTENVVVDTASSTGQKMENQQLKEYAEKKVRTTVDYVTDLAMFIVACWLYLFSNELLAIPPLLIMVYRQLEAEISKRTPKWLIPKRKKET